MHVVLPAWSWNEPSRQSRQVDCSANGLYVPGAHGVGSAEPAAYRVPIVLSQFLFVPIQMARLAYGCGLIAIDYNGGATCGMVKDTRACNSSNEPFVCLPTNVEQ